MNLKNIYYQFNSALTERFCDDVIKYGESLEKMTAITGSQGVNRNLKKNPLTKKEIKDLKKKRDSQIVWLKEEWIYKEIRPFIEEANEKAGWNYAWDFSEDIQFTRYEKNQYYGWHTDSWEEPYKDDNPRTNGKIRKLSVTCNLSSNDDYSGGQLEFANTREGKTFKMCAPSSKGGITVFPSFMWHRVTPVTKGTRFSLVVWNLGYPFK